MPRTRTRARRGPRAAPQERAPRVGFVSLGCPKALVDSERILTQLRAEGYEVAPTYEAADVVVVNTCGFIDAAVDESLDAIGEALEHNGRVIVTGCLGARPERILERHPRVLKVTGPHAYEDVVGAVHEHLPPRHDPFLDLLPPEGVRLTPRHYAYLKIAFQHGSPTVLRRMRRPAHSENTLARIRAWRAQCPDLTIRSTFIVGFPGETDGEFAQLLAWLDEAELDRVGCFKYSPVAGAAANALPDHVAPELQEERYARFMERAAAISRRRLAQRVGRQLRVLVDGVQDGTATARSEADAPQIDGVVRIENAGTLRPGDWAEVRIVAADDYDLTGRLA